jgi:hypothetical protein
MEDTAMQQLLTKLKKYSHSGWLLLDEIEQEILDFGMPIEKRQLESAWWAGHDERDAAGVIHVSELAATEYFDRTYKSE